jgi:hypothetical protein
MSTPFIQFFVPQNRSENEKFYCTLLPGISFSLASVLLTWSRLRASAGLFEGLDFYLDALKSSLLFGSEIIKQKNM